MMFETRYVAKIVSYGVLRNSWNSTVLQLNECGVPTRTVFILSHDFSNFIASEPTQFFDLCLLEEFRLNAFLFLNYYVGTN